MLLLSIFDAEVDVDVDMAHSKTFCAISNCSYTRDVMLSLTCLLNIVKTKRKRRRWSGRNWLKNDQKVILLEKPKLARKLVCEEGSLILVQYHHCSRTDTFLAHSWSRRGLTEHCLLDRMKESARKRGAPQGRIVNVSSR